MLIELQVTRIDENATFATSTWGALKPPLNNEIVVCFFNVSFKATFDIGLPFCTSKNNGASLYRLYVLSANRKFARWTDTQKKQISTTSNGWQ